jgi:hypothetical protein
MMGTTGDYAVAQPLIGLRSRTLDRPAPPRETPVDRAIREERERLQKVHPCRFRWGRDPLGAGDQGSWLPVYPAWRRSGAEDGGRFVVERYAIGIADAGGDPAADFPACWTENLNRAVAIDPVGGVETTVFRKSEVGWRKPGGRYRVEEPALLRKYGEMVRRCLGIGNPSLAGPRLEDDAKRVGEVFCELVYDAAVAENLDLAVGSIGDPYVAPTDRGDCRRATACKRCTWFSLPA